MVSVIGTVATVAVGLALEGSYGEPAALVAMFIVGAITCWLAYGR